MSKFWILTNMFIMLGLMFASQWSGDDITSSLFIVTITWHVFLYFIYLIINRLQLLFKKEKFNDRLLLIPLLMPVICYFYFNHIFNLYDTLHESIFSYIKISENGIVTCQNDDNCLIVDQYFFNRDEQNSEHGTRFRSKISIRKHAIKMYWVYRQDDCLEIDDNKMSIFRHSGYRQCNLKNITEQEALQAGFVLYK